MNIKTRLIYRFVIMVSSIWTIASLTIYFSSAKYRKEEFYRRLEARSSTAAKLLIEFEEVDAELLLKIESANPIKLPGERISIYNYKNEEIFSTDTENTIEVDNELLDRIRLEESVKWNIGPIEVLGILYTENLDRFVVISAAHDVFGKAKLTNLRTILLFVFVGSILVVLVLGRIYAKKALHPISEVVDEVNTIGVQNIDKRISIGNGQDEIAVLGITFNKMLDRLEYAFKSQRSFVANASHELRTPLAAILSQIDVILLKARTIKEYETTLISVREDVDGLSSLVNKLLLLTSTASFNDTFGQIRVDSVIWLAIKELQKQHASYKINVDIDEAIDDELYLLIEGHEQLLKSALLNIIENACKYSSNHQANLSLTRSQKYVVITVNDTGIGIGSEDLEFVTQPFYRAKNAVTIKGHGIGLSLAHRIILLHHGQLDIQSKPEEGTTVQIKLPHLKI